MPEQRQGDGEGPGTPAGGEGQPLVANNGNAPDQAQARQPTRAESFFAITKSLILRALVIYFISYMFRRPAPNAEVNNQSGSAAQSKITAWNLFENGTMFDLHVLYISEDAANVDFNDPSALIWLQEDLMYGDWYGGRDGDGIYTINTQIKASERLMNNGSIYLHTYVTRAGKSPNPAAGEDFAGEDFAGKYMGYAAGMLSKYKKIKRVKTHNLLAGDKEKFEKELDNALVEAEVCK